MLWKYVKPLEKTDSIEKFENAAGYIFPTDFKKCVLRNNGGRPKHCCIDTKQAKGRTIKTLLSFNENDRESIWTVLHPSHTELLKKYIPFATDNFGNYICFCRRDNSVVFAEHETGSIEFIANNFSDFLYSCKI